MLEELGPNKKLSPAIILRVNYLENPSAPSNIKKQSPVYAITNSRDHFSNYLTSTFL